MTVYWYDPISQKRLPMPADKPPIEIYDPAPVIAGLSIENKRIWRAVVATATSSTMATPAEDEEICF